MLPESTGLTALWSTSKLFFAASQQALLGLFDLCANRQKMNKSRSVVERLSRRDRLRILRVLLVALATTVFGVAVRAQSAAEPVRENLLNGLTILFWQRPGDQNVMIKLRINSGAAFDLAGKDGLMALLADAFFPDPTTREYMAEQPGGRLDVATTHDSIEITIAGTSGHFERMVELLRNAVMATQLSPESVSRLRDNRLKRLSEKSVTISEIADREIARRLFGRFPYGHTAEGTPETIAKADRGDFSSGSRLMVAQKLNRAAKIFLRFVNLHCHHQLACFVRLRRRLAVIHVRRQRRVPLAREPVRHILDVRHQPPPLLDHDHTRPLAAPRNRQMPARLSSVALE